MTFEEFIEKIPSRPGYTYDELKNCLTEYEKGAIFGMYMAASCVESCDCEMEDTTGSDTLDRILTEIGENDALCVLDDIILETAEMLISFGDNHPEEDE